MSIIFFYYSDNKDGKTALYTYRILSKFCLSKRTNKMNCVVGLFTEHEQCFISYWKALAQAFEWIMRCHVCYLRPWGLADSMFIFSWGHHGVDWRRPQELRKPFGMFLWLHFNLSWTKCLFSPWYIGEVAEGQSSGVTLIVVHHPSGGCHAPVRDRESAALDASADLLVNSANGKVTETNTDYEQKIQRSKMQHRTTKA